MKGDKTHRDQHSDNLPADLFSGAKIPWEKTKEDVWQDLSVHLQEEPSSQPGLVPKLPGKQWLAMAASLALLLAVGSFFRFHTRTLESKHGEHLSLELPDGSVVELNAVSTLKFHPYWWRVSREVSLDGEAFFVVEKGGNFKVVSTNALTEVLGTSFNVYTRGQEYRVACHSGKVKVSSMLSDESVVLSPDMQATLKPSGAIEVFTLEQEEGSPAWKKHMLMFSSVPLRSAFDEIERQYGIKIISPADMDLRYSGNFALDASAEKVLTLLCLPFELRYEQTSANTYTIKPIPVD